MSENAAEKKRLDQAVLSRGLCESRRRAREEIESGHVFVRGVCIQKASVLVAADAEIELRGARMPYVSRGGLKLQKALSEFEISLSGLTAIDLGASTGGFTDCMLQHGAKLVWAVDVGHGQLAEKLRTDPRVISLEGTDARMLAQGQLVRRAEFASVDLSFISLGLVLPALWDCLAEKASAVCLVKPQFEAGRNRVGKKGIVRDPLVHADVLEGFCARARQCGFSITGITDSPILGGGGNLEFLVCLSVQVKEEWSGSVAALVQNAHLKWRGGGA